VKDVDGATLLHYAAGRGEEKLGLLLKTEARQDINSRSKQGGTPIISAGGSLGATGIYALILAGADVKDRDDYGRGPLHGSTGKYETDDVVAGIKALIKAGVDVNARTSSGRTPLHQHARWSYHQEVIPVLLKAGANPKAKDENGRTPWDYIQDNEELKNTDAYWLLNDARFE
jgi:ankyrin repeat protein